MRPNSASVLVPSTPMKDAQALDVRILQDRRGQRALALGPWRRTTRSAASVTAWIRPVSWTGKKALGNHDVEHTVSDDRADGDQQRQAAGDRNTTKTAPWSYQVDQRRTSARPDASAWASCMRLRGLGPCSGPLAQELGAHHRHQGERHHGRDQDGDRERDGELAEQAAHHVAA